MSRPCIFFLLSPLPSALHFKRKNTLCECHKIFFFILEQLKREGLLACNFSLYSKKHTVYKPFFFVLQNKSALNYTRVTKGCKNFHFGWAIAMKETEDVNSDKRNQLSAMFNPSFLSLESWEQWPLLLVMVLTLRHRPINQRWTAIEH